MSMSKLETNFLTSEERLSLIRDHKLEKDGRKRDRMKFILLYNDGWSYAQIAKVLLLDDLNIKKLFKRLRVWWNEIIIKLSLYRTSNDII